MKARTLFQTSEEALEYLRSLSLLEDEKFDLAETSLALGLIFLPGLQVDRYRQHLHKMAAQLKKAYALSLKEAGDVDTVSLRASALRKIIHEEYEYDGDAESYDDIQNANLIRVIERRRGLPVSLGIIYIILARSMGWDCEGLSFPGHFVIRLNHNSERIILDPFEKGREMEAHDLRDLLKSILGDRAELSHHFYNPVSNREILLRLENNLKKRLIDMEDYRGAVEVLTAIEAFSPDEYRIYLDEGVLYAKLKDIQKAITALEKYVEKAPYAHEKQDGLELLEQIKGGFI